MCQDTAPFSTTRAADQRRVRPQQERRAECEVDAALPPVQLRVQRAAYVPAVTQKIQLTIDDFCRHYVTMFGGHAITNYVHDMQAGHFSYFLQQHKNLYVHANIGLEGTVKTTTSYINKGTQRGGHGGAKGEKFSTVAAMSRHLTNKAVYTLGKVGGDVVNFITEIERKGKAIKKQT